MAFPLAPLRRTLGVIALLAQAQLGPAFALTVDELAPWLSSITEEELRHQLPQLAEPDAPDRQGRTLLDHALCDAPGLVPALLEAGADPARRDTTGGQALHRLMRCDHPPAQPDAAALTEILLNNGLSPDAPDQQGRTPLHDSLARLGDGSGGVHLYRDAALLMLVRGADPTLADARGQTALHLAVTEQDGQITALILDSGADPDPVDQAGHTPLWYAASGTANLIPFRLLLEAGADPVRPGLQERVLTNGAPGKTILLLQAEPAWTLANPEALAQLEMALNAGLPATALHVLHQRSASPAQLDQALSAQAARLLPALTRAGHGTQADWLLARTLDHADGEQRQALLAYAVHQADLALTRRLLEAGTPITGPHDLMADALATDRLPLVQLLSQYLPERHALAPWLLHYIAQGGQQAAMVEWLILDGATLDARDQEGNTAAMLSARRGQHALVDLMLAHGASRTLVNSSGCDLGCYYRAPAGQVTLLPQLNETPAAFFLLAFSPSLLLYFAAAARRLHRRQRLLPLTGALLLALGVSVAASASLFYQCQPCLLKEDAPFWATLSGATLLSLLAMGWIMGWILRRR